MAGFDDLKDVPNANSAAELGGANPILTSVSAGLAGVTAAGRVSQLTGGAGAPVGVSFGRALVDLVNGRKLSVQEGVSAAKDEVVILGGVTAAGATGETLALMTAPEVVIPAMLAPMVKKGMDIGEQKAVANRVGQWLPDQSANPAIQKLIDMHRAMRDQKKLALVRSNGLGAGSDFVPVEMADTGRPELTKYNALEAQYTDAAVEFYRNHPEMVDGKAMAPAPAAPKADPSAPAPQLAVTNPMARKYGRRQMRTEQSLAAIAPATPVTSVAPNAIAPVEPSPEKVVAGNTGWQAEAGRVIRSFLPPGVSL
jgi:hypothetical protein